ncbi:alpha/beta hydrolase [soil metagenome]
MEEDLVAELRGGGTVTYAEHGDPGGRPLVFCHGWPSSRKQGLLCHAEAERLGWRVLTPDRPGIGGTPYQPGRRLGDWPVFVGEFLEALGIGGQFSMLGVSGGAPYVYAAAHAMPDRLVAAGVMSGAVPLGMFPSWREMILPYRALLFARRRSPRLLALGMRLGQRAAFWPRDHPGMRLLFRFIPAQDRCAVGDNLVHECVMGSYRLAVANGPAPLITDADIYLDPWDFRLEDVRVPIHFWHGECDRNIPVTMAREVERRLPVTLPRFFTHEGHYSLPASHIGQLLEAMESKPV